MQPFDDPSYDGQEEEESHCRAGKKRAVWHDWDADGNHRQQDHG